MLWGVGGAIEQASLPLKLREAWLSNFRRKFSSRFFFFLIYVKIYNFFKREDFRTKSLRPLNMPNSNTQLESPLGVEIKRIGISKKQKKTKTIKGGNGVKSEA